MSVTWRMQRMLCENDWAGLQKEGYENEHPSCSIARAIPCDSDVVGPGNPFGVAFHAGDTHSASLCGFCFLTSFLVSECENCMWQPGIWKDDASAPGSVSSLPEQNNECRVSRSCEYSVLSIVTFPFYSGILSNAFWLLLQWHVLFKNWPAYQFNIVDIWLFLWRSKKMCITEVGVFWVVEYTQSWWHLLLLPQVCAAFSSFVS